ncbi:MAG TPA: hypothetical protein VFH27_13150 [Longimicrobiaceae bacterium]|nr:hypothetical protein [Longimicrobiaceae bacterium]
MPNHPTTPQPPGLRARPVLCAVGCLAAALACAPAARAVGGPSAECPITPAAVSTPLVVAVSTAPGVLGTRPVTLGPCRLPAERVRALTSGASGPPVLFVEGIRAPRGADVLVFVDRPGATAATPTTDAGYAGAFTLLGGAQAAEGVSLRVPLGPALAAALRDDGAFTLTLVAAGPQAQTGDAGVSFQRVSLELR